MLLSMNGHGGDTLTRDAGPPVAFLTVLLTGSRATIFPITEHNIRSLYEMNDSCHFGYIASRARIRYRQLIHRSMAQCTTTRCITLGPALRQVTTCL